MYERIWHCICSLLVVGMMQSPEIAGIDFEIRNRSNYMFTTMALVFKLMSFKTVMGELQIYG